MGEIGVGIIGFGLACRIFHAPFVQAIPGLQLRAVVQRTGDEAAARYPNAKIVRGVDEVLGNAAIELVVVATPNQTHFKLARQCLEQGKHVVVDKPFAGSSEEARELIALARSKALILAPFHNRRWDGDFRTVRKIVEAGTLGRLVSFETHFDRYRPIPREGTWKEAAHPANGLLFDLGPHLVDQVLTLFGDPLNILANIRTEREGSMIEDAFDIAMVYPEMMAWCRSTMVAAEASPRYLVHGTNGSFRKFGLDAQEPALLEGATVPPLGDSREWLREDRAAWGSLTIAPSPAEPRKSMQTMVETETGDYRGFYENVRDAILGNAALAVSPDDGLRSVRVLELARLSSHEGRTVAFTL